MPNVEYKWGECLLEKKEAISLFEEIKVGCSLFTKTLIRKDFF